MNSRSRQSHNLLMRKHPSDASIENCLWQVVVDARRIKHMHRVCVNNLPVELDGNDIAIISWHKWRVD
jgi:hypothetical protein